eukprot:6315391-Amphidinium_carterae.1
MPPSQTNVTNMKPLLTPANNARRQAIQRMILSSGIIQITECSCKRFPRLAGLTRWTSTTKKSKLAYMMLKLGLLAKLQGCKLVHRVV